MEINTIIKAQAKEKFSQKRNKVIETTARKAITINENDISFKEILALYIK